MFPSVILGHARHVVYVRDRGGGTQRGTYPDVERRSPQSWRNAQMDEIQFRKASLV